MKLVHFADTHLGFRQYHRSTASGLNQREADVATAFRNTITKTIELRPDVVVIGGDVFHAVRPPNVAILHAYAELTRLRDALPDTIVVMVAGNHDTPRTVETGYIIRLFSTIGIHVVDNDVQRLSFRNGELSILAIPDHFRPLPELKPDPSARFNVLLMHDEVAGIMKVSAAQRAKEVEPEMLNAALWNYVALGHYHVYRQVAPNAYYSGSIEYTSSNIWGEVEEEAMHPESERGKGIIEHDLDTGAHRFHLLPSARRVIDLPRITYDPMMSAQELTDRIIASAASVDISRSVVRLVIDDIPKHVIRDLDHRALRVLKGQAMNFMLDTRRPDINAKGEIVPPKRKQTLREMVNEFLGERVLPADVDRVELVALANKYLDEVDEKTAVIAVGDNEGVAV